MITPTTRLWAVLDYGLAGLSQEEAENANKDIVQAIEDINVHAAAPELLEACKTCQAAMKAMPKPNPFLGTKLMEELDQAIAKAENK